MSAGISRGDILSALSMALDLVEGPPEAHAIRTAHLAIKIGEELELDEQTLKNLCFACLLKDSGCSNNSVRIHKIFGGDDLVTKNKVKLIDWTSTTESLKFAMVNTERGQSISSKLRRMVSNLGPPSKIMNEVTLARCTRGAEITRQLKFDDEVAEAVMHLDEHWDGMGAPFGIQRSDIPLLARIVCLAQTFEVFITAFGIEDAYEMLEQRSRKWFDPMVVDACRSFKIDTRFWEDYFDWAYEENIRTPDCLDESELSEADLDEICLAFADIIDAKSSFTSQHSKRVTEYALELADYYGFDKDRKQNLRRAGLLHDIGKLGVPTSILEKPDRLDANEFATVKQHPQNSDRILRRIKGFERIADLASAHHERLDGRGYWRGLDESQLDFDMRILTVADVFDALSADRPYRKAVRLDKVFEILESDIGMAFDADCVHGIKAIHSREKLVA